MKYVSIDIETTGLSCETNNMIEFAAVIEDTENLVPVEELPTFTAIVVNEKDQYNIGAYCLCLHTELYKRILETQGKLREHNSSYVALDDSSGKKNVSIGVYSNNLLHYFQSWLSDNGVEGKVIAAGKNFMGFDIGFIKKLDSSKTLRFSHRSLDPATLFMLQEDESLLGLDECAKRAGLEFTGDYHRALPDALMVVQLIRKGKKWGMK